MDIDALHAALVSLTLVPEEIRSARENLLTPDGDPRTAVADFLNVVERDLRVAKAALARDLGFALCQCCWPPELMVTDPDGRVDCAARLQTNLAASSRPDASVPFVRGEMRHRKAEELGSFAEQRQREAVATARCDR